MLIADLVAEVVPPAPGLDFSMVLNTASSSFGGGCVDMDFCASAHEASSSSRASPERLLATIPSFPACVLDMAPKAADQHAGDVDLVLPPYTEHDDPSAGAGLKCYKCESTFTTWASILEHIRRKHNINQAALKGTVVYTKGRAELAAKEKTRYQEKKAAKAKAKVASAPAAAAAAVSVVAPAAAAACTRHKEDGSVWKLAWVRIGPDGSMVEPMQVEDYIGKEALAPIHVASTTSTISNSAPHGMDDRVARLLQAIQDAMQAPSCGPSHDMAVVEIKLTAEAIAWQPGVRMVRNKWPLVPDADVNLDDFESYASNMKLQKQASVSQYIQKLRYFYGMRLDFTACSMDADEVAAKRVCEPPAGFMAFPYEHHEILERVIRDAVVPAGGRGSNITCGGARRGTNSLRKPLPCWHGVKLARHVRSPGEVQARGLPGLLLQQRLGSTMGSPADHASELFSDSSHRDRLEPPHPSQADRVPQDAARRSNPVLGITPGRHPQADQCPCREGQAGG